VIFTIMLEPHNRRWIEEFSDFRDVYAKALGSLMLRIEHVGSTSVPDLLAKPILDIDIVIASYETFPQVVSALEKLGYFHNGNQGISGREAFNVKDEFTPKLSPPRKWMSHHLYVCPEHSRELHRHIAFRDALRKSPLLRREYERWKISIASRVGGDRKLYAEIKEEECRALIEKAISGTI